MVMSSILPLHFHSLPIAENQIDEKTDDSMNGDWYSVQLLSSVWLFAIPWTAVCKLPCSQPTLRACSNSCPSSQWYHPTISFSVVLFSSCPQSCPASGSFLTALHIRWPKYWRFSFNINPSMTIQDRFPLGWTGLSFLLSKGLSRVLFSTIIWKHQFVGAQPPLWSNSHICTWLLEKP